MEKIYLIIYKETDTIEGFLEKESDFKKWIKIHNKERMNINEIKESLNEFEIKRVFNLIEENEK